jgi:hypothetical protein
VLRRDRIIAALRDVRLRDPAALRPRLAHFGALFVGAASGASEGPGNDVLSHLLRWTSKRDGGRALTPTCLSISRPGTCSVTLSDGHCRPSGRCRGCSTSAAAREHSCGPSSAEDSAAKW